MNNTSWHVNAATCAENGPRQVSTRKFVATLSAQDGFAVQDTKDYKKIAHLPADANAGDAKTTLEFKGNKAKVFMEGKKDYIQLRFDSLENANFW